MKGHADRSARAAPRDFLTHHTRALSLAIATAVGDAITMHASIIKSRLAAPPPPPGRLLGRVLSRRPRLCTPSGPRARERLTVPRIPEVECVVLCCC